MKKYSVNEAANKSFNDNLFIICETGDIDRLEQILSEEQVDLNHTRWCGSTLLHKAATYGQTDVCEILINHGADINFRTSLGWYTPLHMALANGYTETALVLVLRGANIRLKSKYNEDPFDYGISRGFLKITEELKTRVIKIKMKESLQRNTLTKITSTRGNESIVS